MNSLKGEIESVNVNGSLSLIGIKVNNTHLSAIVIDTPQTAPYLKAGNSINVIFKETEVIIGSGTEHQISLQNKLVGAVQSIESGKLLSKLILDTTVGKVASIITTNAVKKLLLREGSKITAMIKTNEMMLSEYD